MAAGDRTTDCGTAGRHALRRRRAASAGRGPGAGTRRGHCQQRLLAERARRQRRIGQRADAHRRVDAVLDQVDVAVAEADLELQLRMARAQLRQQRHHFKLAQRRGHVEAQAPGRLAAHALGLRTQGVEFLDDSLAARMQLAPVGSEADLPRRAMKQAQADIALEPLDALGDRRRRQAERASRGGKAAAARGLCKGGESLQPSHEGHAIDDKLSAIIISSQKYRRHSAP